MLHKNSYLLSSWKVLGIIAIYFITDVNQYCIYMSVNEKPIHRMCVKKNGMFVDGI